MENFTKLVWTAPTTFEDGSPIEESIEYEVGQKVNEEFVPIYTLVGDLQPDGQYEAPLAELELGKGEQEIALRSFVKSRPDSKSVWSDSVTFTMTGIPMPPVDLQVR